MEEEQDKRWRETNLFKATPFWMEAWRKSWNWNMKNSGNIHSAVSLTLSTSENRTGCWTPIGYKYFIHCDVIVLKVHNQLITSWILFFIGHDGIELKLITTIWEHNNKLEKQETLKCSFNTGNFQVRPAYFEEKTWFTNFL